MEHVKLTQKERYERGDIIALGGELALRKPLVLARVLGYHTDKDEITFLEFETLKEGFKEYFPLVFQSTFVWYVGDNASLIYG